MWATFGILVVALLILLAEVPAMRKKKQNKELWSFSLLLLAGTALSLCQGLGIALPNPTDAISFLFKPMGSWIRAK